MIKSFNIIRHMLYEPYEFLYLYGGGVEDLHKKRIVGSSINSLWFDNKLVFYIHDDMEKMWREKAISMNRCDEEEFTSIDEEYETKLVESIVC